jgi:hypothetical protein
MNRSLRAALTAAFLLALAVTPLVAGDLPLAFDGTLRIWGADGAIGYTGLELLDGRETTVWLWVGGGWEKKTLYRYDDANGTIAQQYLDLGTGSLTPVPSIDWENDPFYQRAEAKWQLGIEQGFATAPGDQPDLLVGFLYYRGRYDAHLDQGDLIFSAPYVLPDRDGIFQNSLLAGLVYRGVVRNAHTVKSGLEAEASAEWGPSFFFNTVIGEADFLRLNATARYFLPLYDAAPDRDRNLFSIYAGDFVSVDWITGDTVPLNIRQSIGGLSPRTGLGGAVRGVDSASLDGYFKAVDNFEVRLLGPALFLPAIVPGAFAFLDAGVFGSAGCPLDPGAWGFVASTGAGVFVDLFNLAQLSACLYYRLVGVNANDSALTPFALEFALKF